METNFENWSDDDKEFYLEITQNIKRFRDAVVELHAKRKDSERWLKDGGFPQTEFDKRQAGINSQIAETEKSLAAEKRLLERLLAQKRPAEKYIVFADDAATQEQPAQASKRKGERSLYDELASRPESK